MNKILCCIPARYNSSRLPGKPLLKINNKTIIQHTYEKAIKTKSHDVIVLTDDKRIFDEVKRFGGKCSIVTQDCLNGTERIIHFLNQINHDEYDIILNIQGDEPFIEPTVVNKIIDNFLPGHKFVCSTACYKTKDKNEILSRSRGKTIVDNNNNILYCSRNVIPSCKKNFIIDNYFYNIHVGIFVFDKTYLLRYFTNPNTQYQLAEDIEWLKIIEQGFTVNTIFSNKMERGIDTIDDYNYLKNKYQSL
jgi:3-deoxy-manno-octulosonate cytidylyltransferase (CMP-KDO synthetase)